jgi:hypothetical protein
MATRRPKYHRCDDGEDWFYPRPGWDLGSVATLTEPVKAVRVKKRAFPPGFHLPKKPKGKR